MYTIHTYSAYKYSHTLASNTQFIEDDIDLSVNVNSIECFSSDSTWKYAFVDMTSDDPTLRRNIDIAGMTVCLDKRKANGKIDNFQDPIIFKFVNFIGVLK